MNSWPPKPGSTVITSSVSKSRQHVEVVLERRARLERQAGQRAGGPDVAGDRARVGAGLGVDGDVARRRPRRSPGAQRSGSSIIRWQSSGTGLTAWTACTTGSPRVRLGTKWASMTSTCSQSASATRCGLVGEPGEVRRQHARRDQRFAGHVCRV